MWLIVEASTMFTVETQYVKKQSKSNGLRCIEKWFAQEIEMEDAT